MHSTPQDYNTFGEPIDVQGSCTLIDKDIATSPLALDALGYSSNIEAITAAHGSTMMENERSLKDMTSPLTNSPKSIAQASKKEMKGLLIITGTVLLTNCLYNWTGMCPEMRK